MEKGFKTMQTTCQRLASELALAERKLRDLTVEFDRLKHENAALKSGLQS